MSFDARGISEFTTAMKKAADEVERFWKPFKDTKDAEKRTEAFFKNLKKQAKEASAEMAALGVGGGTGGKGSKLGGTSTMPDKPGSNAGWSQALRSGVASYRDARNPATGQGVGFAETRRMSVSQGWRAFSGEEKGIGAAGWAALGAGAINLAERYVDRNAAPAAAGQETANWLIQSQNNTQRNWSTGYRDQMAATLANQGLSTRMGGGFIGREDVAGAAMTAQKAGIRVVGGQGGSGMTRMSGAMADAASIGLLTGQSGTAGMGVVAGLRNPQQINTLRMFGVQTQPGGNPQAISKTYAALANYIFGPLGRKATKEEVRLTLRAPGTPAYMILQQAFGGDEQQIEAFVRWMEASAPSNPGGKSTTLDLSKPEDLRKVGATSTTSARRREGMAASEKRRAELDKGLLRGEEQMIGVTEKFNQGMERVLELLGPFADAIGDATGFLGTLGNTLPSHQGGGQGGGMLSNLVSGYITGKGIQSVLGGGGGGAGGGGGGAGGLIGRLGAGRLGAMATRIPGMAAGTTGTAALGATLLAGGISMAGGAVGGKAADWLGVGGTGKGGKRWLAKDAGTIGGAAATGAALGLVGGPLAPITSTAGAIIGTGVGAGMVAWRHKSDIAKGAKKVGSWLNPFGDPVGTWGWRPFEGGIGDPEADAGAASGAMNLRGGGRVQGMNSDFVSRLAQMFADNPKLSLTSGFRTRAEQEKLYREKPNLAAKPGSSKHEKGLAADIGPASEYGWIAKNFEKYGLALPMPGKEPWHVQPAGGVSGGALGAAEASSTAAGEDAGSGGSNASGGLSVSAGGGLSGPTMGQGNYIPLSGGGNVTAHQAGAKARVASGTPSAGLGGGGASGQPVGDESQQEIMSTILRVAREMGADPQVMLAAFETGWVESGMRNLHHGDRDSQGVFQQRPSQGWGTIDQVTNVEYAARSFIKRAMGSKFNRGRGTAGQMAQDVQRSGFPKRYDENRSKAVASLSSLGVDASGVGDPNAGGSTQLNVNVGRSNSGGGGNITIHSLTIPVQIARGTPEEAEKAARQIGDILSNRDRLLQIARS